jgi:hypothetical protein
VKFRVTAEPVGEGNGVPAGSVEVFSDVVQFPGEIWRSQTVDLTSFGNRRTRVCLWTEALGSGAGPGSGPRSGEATESYAYWTNPRIRAANDVRHLIIAGEEDEAAEDLTAEEQEVRMEHLRALGYVE